MEKLDPNFAWDSSLVLLSMLMQLNRKGFSKIFYDDEKEKLLTPTRQQFWDKLAEFNILPTEKDKILIETIIDP